jgi:hypothetical protein
MAEGVDIREVHHYFIWQLVVAHIFDDPALDLHRTFFILLRGGLISRHFFLITSHATLLLFLPHHADHLLLVFVVRLDRVLGAGLRIG